MNLDTEFVTDFLESYYPRFLFFSFYKELKELFKDEKQKQKFATFMTFMFRLLENRLDKDEYQNVRDLNEVIKMTYTFIDYEIDNGRKEGRKEGKLSAFYDMIKQGLITLDQAAKSIGLTKEQLLEGFKEYNLVL